MTRREWICLPLILCNLIILSFNSSGQSTFSHSCDSLHKRIDTLSHSTLENISISAYRVLQSFPLQDTSTYLDLHKLLHTCEALEIQPEIRGRLLAQRIRIGIDQVILMHTYEQVHLSQQKQECLDRFLFENNTKEAVALAYENTYQLEEVTGISHGWAFNQLHFPSPQTELQMTKLLLVGRFIQEVHAQTVRELIKRPRDTWTESVLRESFLLHTDNVSQAYKQTLIGSSISLKRLYQVNTFHLLYPFISDKSFFKTELPNLFMAAAHQESHHRETLEIIQTLGGSWLEILHITDINSHQVKQLLLATPLSKESEGGELDFLVSLGSETFPHFINLLQESNNRLLLARIIRVLVNIPEDKSEMILAIRGKLFELYFLYKGEFLSTVQLTEEFSKMSLLEGGDLMLLLLGDQDQRIRRSALKRLAEIGDSYTYKKLKQILLYVDYGVEKKTIKQAKVSLETIHDRLIPPDPLEISLSSPILEGQSLKEYSVVADQMPQFPGGRAALSRFLAKRTKTIRKHPLEGIIMLKFVVDTEGSLSDIQIVKSLHPLYDQRAISIIHSMPKWLPGIQDGNPIAVSQHLMITFKR